MRTLPDDSVDSVVTDPPYGISFMGKAWDGADIVARTERRRGFASHAPDAGPNGGHKSIAAEAGKYDLAPAAMRAFQDFSEDWAREAFRVLKPGGHLLSFSSARTYHRMTSGIEDAGFEIRDQIMWVFGSGFPKSQNVSKALDKAAGAERAVLSEGRAVKRMIPGADQMRPAAGPKTTGASMCRR
ncbi:site-specific DNA-methyltransferase [Janthinobacterium lividum]|nr:site-specific DNA-methyltransferase [Janthinobacterium lividum]